MKKSAEVSLAFEQANMAYPLLETSELERRYEAVNGLHVEAFDGTHAKSATNRLLEHIGFELHMRTYGNAANYAGRTAISTVDMAAVSA